MSEDAPKEVGELGEFALIERLCARLRPSFQRSEVIVGIGDDAAVIDAGGGRCWVVTCDVQVQGRHFPAKGVSGFHVGHKALAVNISDIAAMGGRPRYAIASLGMRADTPVSFVEEVYDGLNSVANRWSVLLLGGNVTRTEESFFIDIFLMGEAERESVLLRSTAKAGDQILVTGSLGDAAAGLHLVAHPEIQVRDDTHTILTYAFLRPQPRVEEGLAIAQLRLASAMMDLSDGLTGDLGHLCRASGVGAVLWAHALPLSASALELASLTRDNPVEWALSGGEDYQLLLTAPVSAVPALQEGVRAAGGLPLTPIGEIVPASQGIRLKQGDELTPITSRAWDHFRPTGEGYA
ncbi:MAG: thiamine-phosphate kinase [bacterium]